jgi:hypothetical protein
VNEIDRQLAALERAIDKANGSMTGTRDPDRLQRLYLKRERLQEKSFRLFQRQLAGRK